MDATAKLTWLFMIALFPLTTACFLSFTQTNAGHVKIKKRVEELIDSTKGAIVQSEDVICQVKEDGSGVAALTTYLNRSGCFPLFDHTEATYFPLEEDNVMPFGDCPLDEDKVGEAVYMDILNRANDYVHIMTPYLILDGELASALKYAAQRGVDVKLILPGIPDKKAAYALAKSHYQELVNAVLSSIRQHVLQRLKRIFRIRSQSAVRLRRRVSERENEL